MTIPEPAGTLAAIDEAIMGAMEVRPRPHLDIAQIGNECDRNLWLSFRWASIGREVTASAIRRHSHEKLVKAQLKVFLDKTGAVVQDFDSQGNPFRFSDVHGHFQGAIDGVVIGLKEAPKTYHLLMLEVLPNAKFNALEKHGLFSERQRRFYEAHVSMHLAGLDRAFYLAVNANDDRLYAERVKLEKPDAQRMIQRAESIVKTQDPPPKLAVDGEYYLCKGCDFHALCHGDRSTLVESGGEDDNENDAAVIQVRHPMADVNCRTCLHATPEIDGVARWTCARWTCDIPEEGQRLGCGEHRYIPALVHYAKAIDGDIEANTVTYQLTDGRQFVNGSESPAYSSLDLKAIDPALIGDAGIEALRTKMDAKIVDRKPVSTLDEEPFEAEDDVPW